MLMGFTQPTQAAEQRQRRTLNIQMVDQSPFQKATKSSLRSAAVNWKPLDDCIPPLIPFLHLIQA